MDPHFTTQDEPPPPYNERNSTSFNVLPPREAPYSPSFIDSLEEGGGPSCLPPPFTLTPATLTILPNSMLISTCTPNITTCALYELSRPLSGYARSVGIADIGSQSKLGENGMFKDLKEKETAMIWRVGGNLDSGMVICDQKTRRSLVLRTKAHWSGKGWEVKGEEKEGTWQYSGKLKKGVVEWKDGKGDLTAVEMPAVDRKREAEKLEVLVEIEKADMDLLVACWVARILQGMQKEGEKEMKEEQWRIGATEGKLHGRLYGCEFY
jgi:hypothetical protein